MMSCRTKMNSGLTLVEALMAVFVLAIVLVGAYTMIIGNLRVAESIENNMIANALAQEGMEVFRNIRDSDWLVPEGGVTILSLGSSTGPPRGWYEVQWNTSSPTYVNVSILAACLAEYNPWPVCSANDPGCPTPSCALRFLKYDDSTGVYSYDTGVNTIYQRGIYFYKDLSERIIAVAVVTWRERGVQKEVKVATNYYNWFAPGTTILP